MPQPNRFLPARRHLAFVLGLGLAVAAAFKIDATLASQGPRLPVAPSDLPSAAPRALTAAEREIAAAALAYLRKHQRPSGLVDSVAGFPGATMWDSASALLGLVAARRLELLPAAEFEDRAGRLLGAVAKLPLVADKAPNKSYQTATLKMTDYDGKETATGIGWSALDLARFLVAAEAVARLHPGLAPQAARAVGRWRLAEVVKDGELVGLERSADGDALRQEGRVGYEQYGAWAMHLAGRAAWRAERPELHLETVKVDGLPVPTDDRDPARFGAHVYALSEPYMLYGMEFGLDGPMAAMAHQIYEAQEARHRATGTLTAVTEDHLDRAPYFVYNAVWADGHPWACITDKGEARPQDRTLSAKAALGLGSLYPGAYADRLTAAARELVKPGEGLLAGRYEADGKPNSALTANTNGVALEALAYRAHGPILAWAPR